MNLSDHRFAFAYNTWANERIFNGCETLSDRQLTHNLGGSFPYILRTAEHLFAAEWVWLLRWQGDIQPAQPDWLPVYSFSGLMQIWRTLESDRARYLSEMDLKQEVQYIFSSGYADSSTLSQLLRHLINHSTYHRGQLAEMLRRLIVVPPATDMVLFKA